MALIAVKDVCRDYFKALATVQSQVRGAIQAARRKKVQSKRVTYYDANLMLIQQIPCGYQISHKYAVKMVGSIYASSLTCTLVRLLAG